jgi:hypothetical protein
MTTKFERTDTNNKIDMKSTTIYPSDNNDVRF